MPGWPRVSFRVESLASTEFCVEATPPLPVTRSWLWEAGQGAGERKARQGGGGAVPWRPRDGGGGYLGDHARLSDFVPELQLLANELPSWARAQRGRELPRCFLNEPGKGHSSSL